MTVKEMKAKAQTGNLKLEDLEIEDILKFGDEGFINNELSKCFNISKEEVKKIKKKKKITDSYYEDCIRNIIVLIDNMKEEHPEMPKEYLNAIAIGMISGLEDFRGQHSNYLNKARIFDWANMDTKKEIEERKIDVEYRLKKVNKILQLVEKNDTSKNTKYQNKLSHYSLPKEEFLPKRKPKKHATKNEVYVYPRDKNVAKRALAKAHYRCELNPLHPTFISRSTGERYMEPHHLIPLDFYDLFEYSLDVEDNIICLCSNCHNEIHYGVNYKQLIEKLYNERKDSLKKCGIEIRDIKILYQMYDHIEKEKIEL